MSGRGDEPQAQRADTVPLTLADKLRHAFEESGLSLADVAAETDVSPAFVSQLNRGKKTNPTLRVLKDFSRIYRVPLSYLVDDTVTEYFSAAAGTPMLATKLKRAIEARRWTPAEVAAAAGSTAQTISRLLDGSNTNITLTLLQKLARLLQLPVSYLVDDSVTLLAVRARNLDPMTEGALSEFVEFLGRTDAGPTTFMAPLDLKRGSAENGRTG